MTDTLVNGNGIRAAAVADALAGMHRDEIADKYGKSDGWAGGVITESGRSGRATRERLAANGGGPASGVSPPRMPAPRAIATKPAATRPRRAGRAPWYLVAVVVAAIGIVATVTFTISYGHISDLAAESGLVAHAGMYPLGIDGLVIACTGFLMVDKLNGRRGPWLARLGVVLGLAGTIAGNVLAVPRNPVAMVGAGIMPAALAVVVHLGFRFLGREP